MIGYTWENHDPLFSRRSFTHSGNLPDCVAAARLVPLDPKGTRSLSVDSLSSFPLFLSMQERDRSSAYAKCRRAKWLRIFGSLGKIETWTTHQGHDCTSLTARYFRPRDVTQRRKLEIEDGPLLLGCSRGGRYRERQYQLAAQKHNEEFLKHDYYQQIANYFERECRIAKQYNSWDSRGSDPKGELEKAKKAERLLVRKNKLRNLLKAEDETYRKELEKRNRLKNRPEVPSLEVLKQRLKEKRAEQSLYLPKTCRRYQSYFVCPKEADSSRSSTLKDTNLQYSRVCRDSTNLIHQNEHSYRCPRSGMSKDSNKKSQENFEIRRPSFQFTNELVRPNSRYSARYARRSLENTNVRNDDFSDYAPNRMSSRSSLNASNERHLSPNDKENQQDAPSTPPEVKAAGFPSSDNHEINTKDLAHQKESPHRRSSFEEHTHSDVNRSMDTHSDVNRSKDTHSDVNRSKDTHSDVNRSKDTHSDVNRSKDTHSDVNRSKDTHSDVNRSKDTTDDAQQEIVPESSHQERDQQDKYSAKEDLVVENTKEKDNRQFEVEKSMPWLRMDPGDKNLSKQMFLYLTYKELKRKIEDLTVRESHACKKQCWDEALRLRDMRNRLELLREKKLYSIDNLDVDEETKKSGLINIDKRESELAAREDACTDSTMYSEDAKALWKKWVHEDERSVIQNARQQREKMMNILEKEWQGLAIRDKERISQSYQTVMNESELQDEHTLAAALNANKMKFTSTSFQ